jgi:predicted HD phosphohydrolase
VKITMLPTNLQPFANIDEVLDTLWEGRTMYDEPNVDVLSHSVQTALVLEEWAASKPLVIAGLLHDISDALGLDHTHHEILGGLMVEPLFGYQVAELVRSHAKGKRYLVTKFPAEYAPTLSERSLSTLEFQGGTMSETEIQQFESHPLFADMVLLRKADEKAKNENFDHQAIRSREELAKAFRDLLEASVQGR